MSGQIYIPRVNTALLVGVLLLVGLFRTSSALASAYGIAVATTMVVDGLLGFIVIWKLWHWPLWKAALLMAPFVIVDLTFFSANFLKLFEGAWAPLLFGATMVLLILTWRRGTAHSDQQDRRTEVPLDTLLRSWRRSRRISCRARRCSSPAIRNSRRPRCCTISSTTRCCTSTT